MNRLLGSLAAVALAGALVLAAPRPDPASWTAATAPGAGAVLGASTVATPARVRLPVSARVPVSVPILEYHYIRVNPDPNDRLGFNLSVTPDAFHAQLDWLTANGYHPVTIADLDDYFQEGRPLPAKAIVLSFDDGYQDFYDTAWPALADHGFAGVSYVVPGFLGGRGYMTPGEVVALDRAGIEIGSHTLHHVNLAAQPPDVLNAELQGSRAYLEKLLGHPVRDFCYPSGKYNPAVLDAVNRAGYVSATTEVAGTRHSWSDRLTWTRVRVGGGETLDQFAASLAT